MLFFTEAVSNPILDEFKNYLSKQHNLSFIKAITAEPLNNYIIYQKVNIKGKNNLFIF